MSIRIITDAAADLSAQERSTLGVRVIPLQVIFGEETFLTGETLSRDTFWARLTGGETPTTSQPSPETFLHAFEDALDAGDEVVYIAVSSALSGTMQSAMLARSMVNPEAVHIVDSRSVSVGQKLLVIAACRLRDEGRLCAAQIAKALEQLSSRVRVLATVDTLEYLARGGRISKAAASIGTLAQLKPQIMISPEGTVEVAGKAIGRHRAIEALVKKIASVQIDREYPVIPVYSHIAENADAFMRRLIKEGIACDANLLTDLGPAIGTHAGPNAFGLAFVENDRGCRP